MQPFSDSDSYSAFTSTIEGVVEEIRKLANDYVLKASQVELEDHFVEKASIDALRLHIEDQYIENQSQLQLNTGDDYGRSNPFGQSVSVNGTQLTIAIPYEGEAILWQIRPSRFSLGGYPDIEVRDAEIFLRKTFADNSVDTAQLKSEIDRNIRALGEVVDNLRIDVDNHNQSIRVKIEQELKRKRSQAQSAIGAVAALGIPVKRADSQPAFAVPAKRRSRPVHRPTVATAKYSPEPILEEKEYDYILGVMRSLSLVIERNPQSFSTLDEEAIRDHFLLQLNGHYQGGATGETFNASGKTDILIREGDKNVFIAECKFWGGQKAFKEAVSQLLGYLTWRDSKTALMIFNRTKDSSSVREKMHIAMESLHEHRKTTAHEADGESRYVLIKDSEPGKEIIVTTQVYDIPPK